MQNSLSTLALAMSLAMAACSGPAPIHDLNESDAGQPGDATGASPSASAVYDPKPASPTPGGVNAEGDLVGDTNSWAMMDDPKTAFPVTIKHAYGETTIKSQPKRLVTLDQASTGAATIMVRVPNAFPKLTEGANEQGLSDAMFGVLEGFQNPLGSPNAPTLLDMSKGIPFEDVKQAKPDVILALQDEINEADYNRLSEIAPTILRPGKPGETSQSDLILTTGKALGMYNHAKELLNQLEEEPFDAFKSFKDKSVIVAQLPTDPEQPFRFYPEPNIRTQVLMGYGFKPADVVQQLSAMEDAETVEWPAAKADDAKSDVVIAFAKNHEEADKIRQNPAVQALPATKSGNLVIIENPVIKEGLINGDPLFELAGRDPFIQALKEQTKFE